MSPKTISSYAPPAAEKIRRDGNLLIVPLVATLPDRCVKCDAPCDGYRVTKRFYRNPPIYLQIFPLNLIFLITSLLRKRITVAIGLCPRHRRSRNRAMSVGLPLCAAALGLTAYGISAHLESSEFGLGGILMIVGMVVFLSATYWTLSNYQILKLKKADGDNAWFKGVSPPFLRSVLPVS